MSTISKRMNEPRTHVYTTAQVLRHVMCEDGLCYFVVWYMLSAADNTGHLAENIPKHFETSIWKGREREMNINDENTRRRTALQNQVASLLRNDNGAK